ncbi:ABATE domain-containing protein [Kribbella sp. NBC_01245]|uniref:CGNR zinc finger domain-containing protein n=1 Tax=Kribbella sp. NBC_01245 TaxID=2903578 RepID=UPI002E2BAF76|nr:CGNR zinc finger domain-containing protein [Kribbella sp. NBC_01245]
MSTGQVSAGLLAFNLAATIRNDGQGGVADGLDSPAKVDAWVLDNADLAGRLVGELAGALNRFEADAEGVERIVGVRRAVRSLFAQVVGLEAASKADAQRLLEPGVAIAQLNDAAKDLRGPLLEWASDGPVPRWEPVEGLAEPIDLLIAALGRSGVGFLVGPDRDRLRACPAARCVKYFLQDDPRQTWCTPTCGNRERVNRHYRKHTTP